MKRKLLPGICLGYYDDSFTECLNCGYSNLCKKINKNDSLSETIRTKKKSNLKDIKHCLTLVENDKV